MSFRLSEPFLIRLRDGVRQVPMQADEVRRVVGVGNYYIALSSASIDHNVYCTFFTLFIDDKDYTVYFKP